MGLIDFDFVNDVMHTATASVLIFIIFITVSVKTLLINVFM